MTGFDIRPRLIAELVGAHMEAPVDSPATTWTHLARLAADVDLGPRRSFELRRLAGFTEIYLQLFRPSPDWTLAEVTSESGLVWTAGDAAFGDLLVISSPKAAVLSPEGRTASNGLLAAGVDAVRILKLTAPLVSLLLTSSNAPLVPLVDSDLWFGPSPLAAAEVVAAASGGGS